MLTQKAIDFTPIIIEMTLWGDKYLRQFNKIDHIEGLDADKSEVIQIIKMLFRNGESNRKYQKRVELHNR